MTHLNRTSVDAKARQNMIVANLYLLSSPCSHAFVLTSGQQQVFYGDPIRTTQLSEYVGAMLRTVETVCGAENFQSMYLSKSDPLVLEQIWAELRT